MGTYGILLPCDGTEPLPVSVGDHLHIAEMVGGIFDVVDLEYDEDRMSVLDKDGDPFIAVGYVNDTGLVDGLPINAMASIVFQRVLHGPVVVVSGTSPDGEYDGYNYDLPTWFTSAVFDDGALWGAGNVVHNISEVESKAVILAMDDGVFDLEQRERLVSIISQPEISDSELDEVGIMIAIALTYYFGREAGVIDKFDRGDYEAWLDSQMDDEIRRLLDDEGGN